MKCPGADSYCGGNLALDIFFTGVKIVKEQMKPMTVDSVRWLST